MKPYKYLYAILFTLGVLLPNFTQAKVGEGHKKAAKYMKTLPSKSQRAPASAGKHKVKHPAKRSGKTAKNHSSSNRKPASKKKAKKPKSKSKKSKKTSKSYGG